MPLTMELPPSALPRGRIILLFPRPREDSASKRYIIFVPPRKARFGIMKVTMPSGMRTICRLLLPEVPNSSMATFTLGSSVNRFATTQPATPPPTMT